MEEDKLAEWLLLQLRKPNNTELYETDKLVGRRITLKAVNGNTYDLFIKSRDLKFKYYMSENKLGDCIRFDYNTGEPGNLNNLNSLALVILKASEDEGSFYLPDESVGTFIKKM